MTRNTSFAQRFGENLRVCRDRRGISQETLGQRAGLHRTAVGQIERGERVARCDTLVKLACALEASPLDFLEGLAWRPAEMVIGGMEVMATQGGAVGPAGERES
jgi:transcriptional regulator with XRE-family HTH domain